MVEVSPWPLNLVVCLFHAIAYRRGALFWDASESWDEWGNGPLSPTGSQDRLWVNEPGFRCRKNPQACPPVLHGHFENMRIICILTPFCRRSGTC
jgi:hypothetical protein